MRHVSSVSEPDVLHSLIWSRLRELGIHPPPSKGCSGLRVRASKRLSSTSWPPSTPSNSKNIKCRPTIFGRALRDLPRVFVPLDLTSDIPIPSFLSFITEFISMRSEKEGIFRLSGSESRQKILRNEIETHLTEEGNDLISSWTHVSVLDAASILKQWIRELPEPIISHFYIDILIKCLSLSDLEYRSKALIYTTCLLPETNSSTLTHLIRFLASIAKKSEINKMDFKNLAIVLAPSLFPSQESSKKPSLQNTKSILYTKTLLLEQLILMSEKICLLEPALEDAYNNVCCRGSTSISEDNVEESSSGPSARRSRKKKKRRSGSLSRVLSATMKGIQKAISRSTTPSVSGSRNNLAPSFTPSPNGARKRRVDDSDSKVKNTPKIRGRSFSVKRFKRKKGGGRKDQSPTHLHLFTPPPPPPTTSHFAMSATPRTPDVLEESALRKASLELSSDDSDVGDFQVGILRRHHESPFHRHEDPSKFVKRRSKDVSTSHEIKMSFTDISPPSKDKKGLGKMDSLANLKKDISSLIESSFALSEDEPLLCNIIHQMKSCDVRVEETQEIDDCHSSRGRDGPSENHLLQIRRTSFDFALPTLGVHRDRRQSSAFEIGKKKYDTIYNRLDEESSRLSLRRKNSSVKNLVHRIESNDSKETFLKSGVEWRDAKEFFGSEVPRSEEHGEGEKEEEKNNGVCRRSSILRLRNQNKGIVLKSVENFSGQRPSVLLKAPTRTRCSARMGLSLLPILPLSPKTQTGIRTNAGRLPNRLHSCHPVSPDSLEYRKRVPTTTMTTIPNPSRLTPINSISKKENKKQNKKQNRRYLTIGYEGEVGELRTPLKDKVNVSSMVQRSKSDQSPIQRRRRKRIKHKRERNLEDGKKDIVSRSASLKVQMDGKVEAVKRNISDQSLSCRGRETRRDDDHSKSKLTRTSSSFVRKSPRHPQQIY